MAKRKHGAVAVKKKQPILYELLKKDQVRVLGVLHKHGVYFDAGTFITMMATLDKVAAYHAVPNRKKFIAELLGR
jgi:hypothetical protein